MFYEPNKANHGFKNSPLKACIAPRPIAWISTISDNKAINIAPFSFFNLISDDPAMIMVSISQKDNKKPKDTLYNIQNNHEFTVNIVPNFLENQMVKSSDNLDYGLSEVNYADIKTIDSVLVKPPRIDGCPVALECKLFSLNKLPENRSGDDFCTLVLAQIIGVYIDDQYIYNDKVNTKEMNLVARLGYNEYTTVSEIYTINRKK